MKFLFVFVVIVAAVSAEPFLGGIGGIVGQAGGSLGGFVGAVAQVGGSAGGTVTSVLTLTAKLGLEGILTQPLGALLGVIVGIVAAAVATLGLIATAIAAFAAAFLAVAGLSGFLVIVITTLGKITAEIAEVAATAVSAGSVAGGVKLAIDASAKILVDVNGLIDEAGKVVVVEELKVAVSVVVAAGKDFISAGITLFRARGTAVVPATIAFLAAVKNGFEATLTILIAVKNIINGAPNTVAGLEVVMSFAISLATNLQVHLAGLVKLTEIWGNASEEFKILLQVFAIVTAIVKDGLKEITAVVVEITAKVAKLDIKAVLTAGAALVLQFVVKSIASYELGLKLIAQVQSTIN